MRGDSYWIQIINNYYLTTSCALETLITNTPKDMFVHTAQCDQDNELGVEQI